MAAHIVTFFKQVIELDDGRFDEWQLDVHQHALSFAMLGDNLETADWRILVDASNPDLFMSTVKDLLPAYEQKWKDLGEPATAEEWQTEKWKMIKAKEAL